MEARKREEDGDTAPFAHALHIVAWQRGTRRKRRDRRLRRCRDRRDERRSIGPGQEPQLSTSWAFKTFLSLPLSSPQFLNVSFWSRWSELDWISNFSCYSNVLWKSRQTWKRAVEPQCRHPDSSSALDIRPMARTCCCVGHFVWPLCYTHPVCRWCSVWAPDKMLSTSAVLTPIKEIDPDEKDRRSAVKYRKALKALKRLEIENRDLRERVEAARRQAPAVVSYPHTWNTLPEVVYCWWDLPRAALFVFQATAPAAKSWECHCEQHDCAGRISVSQALQTSIRLSTGTSVCPLGFTQAFFVKLYAEEPQPGISMGNKNISDCDLAEIRTWTSRRWYY